MQSSFITKIRQERQAKHDNQTVQSDCNTQLIALFLKDVKKILSCLFEDENKD